jgi:hypothetical protein
MPKDVCTETFNEMAVCGEDARYDEAVTHYRFKMGIYTPELWSLKRTLFLHPIAGPRGLGHLLHRSKISHFWDDWDCSETQHPGLVIARAGRMRSDVRCKGRRSSHGHRCVLDVRLQPACKHTVSLKYSGNDGNNRGRGNDRRQGGCDCEGGRVMPDAIMVVSIPDAERYSSLSTFAVDVLVALMQVYFNV